MRHWCSVLFVLATHFLSAQLRINELHCTRMPGSDGQGPNGDWVELHNAGPSALELEGYALSMNGTILQLAAGLTIGPGGFLVLWCDKAADKGPDHLHLDLPRKGGALLLIAPDQTTVIDVFSWPSLPAGVSIGRKMDGGRSGGFFINPGPGRSNSNALSHLLKAPVLHSKGNVLRAEPIQSGEIRYTVDGTEPGPGSPQLVQALRLPEGTVVRARTFAKDAVPSLLAMHTMGIVDSAWGLMVQENDLYGKDGIADMAAGNQARKGRHWQRQAWLQQGSKVIPVGVAIAGSGSRSLPKRNFKLLVRDRFDGMEPISLPDGTGWKSVFLRADGTPDSFLRNAFMEEIARRSGSHVDVQPGFPLPLYLNGEYHGLYRAMPTKGSEWIQSLNGGDPVEIIEGPGIRVVSGNDQHYRHMLEAITSMQTLDTLDRSVDMSSLIELACYDLWTGRADHELNVRCWRPRDSTGRWRWVMYDMDQWAPPNDNSVQRMCGAGLPEAPYLPQLLADRKMQDRLLARISTLAATTLSPDRATAVADSLYSRFRQAMMRDHLRWKDEMASPSPERAHMDLLDHIANRCPYLLDQLAQYTGRTLRNLTIQVEPADGGSVHVEDLFLTGTERELRVFEGVPLHLQATAGTGMEFAGWKGAPLESDQAALTPRRNMRITAVFRPSGLSRKGGL